LLGGVFLAGGGGGGGGGRDAFLSHARRWDLGSILCEAQNPRMPRAVSTSVRGGQCPWSVPAGLVVALVVRAAGRLALPLCRAPLLRRGHGVTVYGATGWWF